MSLIGLVAEKIQNEMELLKLLRSFTNKPLMELKRLLASNQPFFEIDGIRDKEGVKKIKAILAFANKNNCKIKIYERFRSTDTFEPKYEITQKGVENLDDEEKTLLDEDSPIGSLTARVVEVANTVYFYLHHGDSFRCCWVCNTIPVEETGESDEKQLVASMIGGMPPTIPATHCRHAGNGMTLDEDELEVVWFEDMDRAALLYKDEIMVVMPPWEKPSKSMCEGYSREYIGTPLLGIHPLDDFPHAEKIVKRSQKFWNSWDDPDTWAEAWQEFRDPRMALLEKHFGPHTHYFAIDGQQFPPRALLVFDQGDYILLITIGVSILAQPSLSFCTDEPELFRRIELGMAVDKSYLKESSLEKLGGFISDMAKIPWRDFTWFAHGHTMECDIEKKEWYHSILFAGGALNHFNLLPYQDDPTTLLWIVPITSEEMAFKMQHSGEELLAKLDESRFIVQGNNVGR